MFRKLLFLSFCFLSFTALSFASKRAFTIEDLYRLRSIEDLDVSPDGKVVVVALRDDDLPRAKRIHHLWLMDFVGLVVLLQHGPSYAHRIVVWC